MTPPRAHHRVFLPALPADDAPIGVEGEEAHHGARVKRLRPGEGVELFDGRGVTRAARVVAVTGPRAHPVLELEPSGPVVFVDPVRPSVEVCAPAPKGDRLGWMVDQLSQAGAAAWRPMACARGERQEFHVERAERVALESAKQCGRAHLLRVGAPIGFVGALDHPCVLVCDAGGASAGWAGAAGDSVRVLVGPEGGFSEDERALARARGVPWLVLGPHVLRVETAAVLACARVVQEGRR